MYLHIKHFCYNIFLKRNCYEKALAAFYIIVLFKDKTCAKNY